MVVEDAHHMIPEQQEDEPEHDKRADCWCEPVMFLFGPEVRVYMHRHPPEETDG